LATWLGKSAFPVNVNNGLQYYPPLLQTVRVPLQNSKELSHSTLASHATHIIVLLMLLFQKENSP
jgi:hypothetical protein